MSDTIEFAFDLVAAAEFNTKVGPSIGWAGKIPPKAIETVPGLSLDYTTTEFAEAVYQLQGILGWSGHNQDGKMGRGTWGKVLKTYDYVDEGANYIVHNGRRLPTDPERDYQLINYDQKGGFDLHPHGDFSKRKAEITLIVLHWGSISGKALHRALRNRDISSHFGIEKDKIFQYLDIKHRAWHAGFVNAFSIGIDFCQQPTTKWFDHFRKKGYDVEIVDNPTDRGDDKIVTLNPEAVLAGRQLVEDLCEMFGIPFRVPRGKDGLAEEGPLFHGVIDKEALKSGAFKGVVGHHHTRKTKWDIAPFWPQLFGDLA